MACARTADEQMMVNPYESPSSIQEHTGGDLPRHVKVADAIGAGLLCSFACYVPFPGLRGAAFCLFAGLAQRSTRIALKGAAWGFLADFAVMIAWAFIGGVWEPRDSYNQTLVENLPPDFLVATHVGSSMSNGMKFGLGLVVWTQVMYAIWMTHWIPGMDSEKRLRIHVVGAVCVSVCAVILWIVAPLDGWWRHGAQPFGDLAPIPFLVVFLSTMPCCSTIVAFLIHVASKRPLLTDAAAVMTVSGEQNAR